MTREWWASDLPEGEPDSIKRIRAYDSFAGFVTDILPIEEANRKVRELNDGPKEKVAIRNNVWKLDFE